MKDFALEILNAGSSDNVSLLSEEEMSEVFGGAISCKKGYELGDDGKVSCACSYRNDPPPPPRPTHPTPTVTQPVG